MDDVPFKDKKQKVVVSSAVGGKAPKRAKIVAISARFLFLLASKMGSGKDNVFGLKSARKISVSKASEWFAQVFNVVLNCENTVVRLPMADFLKCCKEVVTNHTSSFKLGMKNINAVGEDMISHIESIQDEVPMKGTKAYEDRNLKRIEFKPFGFIPPKSLAIFRESPPDEYQYQGGFYNYLFGQPVKQSGKLADIEGITVEDLWGISGFDTDTASIQPDDEEEEE